MRRITSGAVRRALPLVLVAALAACSSGAAESPPCGHIHPRDRGARHPLDHPSALERSFARGIEGHHPRDDHLHPGFGAAGRPHPDL